MTTLRFAMLCVVALVLVSQVTAQVPFLGRCPNVRVQQNFVPASYLGKWFEYKKYFAIFEADGSCITATYTDLGSGYIGVDNRQYSTLLGRYKSITGSAVSTGSSSEGKLSVRFPTAGNFPANYWVLGTDYTSYAVVWSCTDLLIANIQFAWVLTRAQMPTSSTVALADGVLTSNGIALDPFMYTAQNNCP